MSSTAPSTPLQPRPQARLLLMGYVVVTGFLAAVAVLAFSILQVTRHFYESFGARVPWMSALLIGSIPCWGVMPLLSAAAGIQQWRRLASGRSAAGNPWLRLGALGVLGFAMLAFALAGFYLPVHRLGEPVSECVPSDSLRCIVVPEGMQTPAQ